MRDHTVSAYDAELDVLRATVIEMGRLAEEALAAATGALFDGDADEAREVVAADARIDALALAVEVEAVAITAKRQPVASDLREVFTAHRISIDLERVGDLAKGIARRVLAVDPALLRSADQSRLTALAERVSGAFERAVEAYRQGEVDLAEEVRENDDAIDRLYSEASRDLMLQAKESRADVECALHLLFCAKNLERIGDHATNIAEATVYRISGTMPSAERPRAVDVP